ncbi:hypothetical protein PVL30_000421 [Lodderomyces elongisporus]|uniref:Uncharacterized protein n=1 Tax=Lodderomyces elongisporus (strain ATCC 11503 / CBS 2605 / JCM 1781 / NBRC 1676 / NRRL YB-4239) TaxID=379508 RepID=A5DSU4_LODEL|nr:uncharacterized protein PVL30_000421 [Lodderomyces elongisporus]EDK42252.1 predicted protein [Lodderomyces elongisporus NRRL YB-4239]WLF76717.1 hypothetical protein PVL30_000421 [Lodderomyces elongisporus]
MSTSITNPDNYTLRDTLLISQLLHINKIATIEDLEKTDPKLITKILDEWKNHISTRLEEKIIKINTLNQLKDLYKRFLAKYGVGDTESLANVVYFKRIEELKKVIEEKKIEFKTVLNQEKEKEVEE